MSTKRKLGGDWQFSKQPLQTDLAKAAASNDWMPVTLPHDWLIYDTNNLYENGEGWYRKTLTLDEVPPLSRLALRFEGVYMNSTLYVNGHVAGTWKYGYSTFDFDITPYLTAGDNIIYVRVIHESPNSRWYSGAGIYRPVWVITSVLTHIAPDGIYIASRKTAGDSWTVNVEAELRLGKDTEASQLKLRHSILDAGGMVITRVESAILLKGSDLTIRDCTTLTVEQPLLWDINHPHLYKLKTELLSGNEVIDEEQMTFGFRTIELDSQTGFFLNGRHVKLNGVCQHHDLGCLGAAVNKAALRRQFVLLQEMGVNAIRTAHNMPAVELMELADELGVLIVSEAFDMWERHKTPYDYARFFPEWWKQDVAS